MFHQSLLVALCTFLFIVAASTVSKVSTVSTVRKAFPLETTKSLDEWVQVFKAREGDGRKGGVRVHRLLETDPLPPQTPTRLLSLCLKYSEYQQNFAVSEYLGQLKKQFWEEIKPMGLSLLHPLCVRVMAECGDVLDAQEALDLIKFNPILVFSNHELLTRIPDYSLFTPEDVQLTFETPLLTGLNIAKIPNVLRTLSAESLVKLLEIMSWDLEEWEMKELVDARGGIEALVKDLSDHINSWHLLYKFPWIIEALSPNNSIVSRVISTLESKSYQKDQIFIALINLIVLQEFLLQGNSIVMEGSSVDENFKKMTETLTRNVLEDKIRIKNILKESDDFTLLYQFISTPLSSHVALIDGLYENVLPDSLTIFIENWKTLVKTFLGDSNAFGSSSTARTLIGLVIQNYPAEEETIEESLRFFSENRLRLLHFDSILALKRAWPLNEKVLQIEWEYFNQEKSDALEKRSIVLFKEICQEAANFYMIFNQTRSNPDLYNGPIGAWVSFQMSLQAAGSILKQFDQNYVAQYLLPFLLKDEQVGGLVEEYPNLFLSNEVITYLLENDKDLFKKYPRLLHGLSDYSSFSGSDLQSLSIDFSNVRRGLSTIPTIQLINFLKSKQGLINDPIGFIGSLSPSIWNNTNYVKYLNFYFRSPLIIEEIEYGKFIDAAYFSSQYVVGDAKNLLWLAVKFAINNEILYQEFLVADKTSLTGIKANIANWLFRAEGLYRPDFIVRLQKMDLSSEENLKPFYAAVIKTLQSVPLSRDRFTIDAIKNLFPSFSVKSCEANFTKSIQNFKVIIGKFAENEDLKDFWLFLLAICSGDFEFVASRLADERIPLYYRVLGKRRLDLQSK